MSTFVSRLKAPRPTFALDMSDEEREIMGRHASYWQPLVDSGRMVVLGPVLDGYCDDRSRQDARRVRPASMNGSFRPSNRSRSAMRAISTRWTASA